MHIPTNTAGIDCGYRNTGVVVFSPGGRPLHAMHYAFPRPERVPQWEEQYVYSIQQSLWFRSIVRKWRLSKIAVELPTGSSQSHRALRAMTMAFATVVTTLTLLGVELLPVLPRDIKLLTKGHAKDEVIAWARRDPALDDLMFGVKYMDEHVADAAAAACCEGLYLC